MFIVVRYGDDCKEVFNADCKNAALIAQIKKRCRCKEDEIIELSDEKGQVKLVLEHAQEYGTKFFRDREAVVLLLAERKEYNHADSESEVFYYHYTPLLKALQNNQAFLSKLNPSHREPKKNPKKKKDDSTGHTQPSSAMNSERRKRNESASSANRSSSRNGRSVKA